MMRNDKLQTANIGRPVRTGVKVFASETPFAVQDDCFRSFKYKSWSESDNPMRLIASSAEIFRLFISDLTMLSI